MRVTGQAPQLQILQWWDLRWKPPSRLRPGHVILLGILFLSKRFGDTPPSLQRAHLGKKCQVVTSQLKTLTWPQKLVPDPQDPQHLPSTPSPTAPLSLTCTSHSSCTELHAAPKAQKSSSCRFLFLEFPSPNQEARMYSVFKTWSKRVYLSLYLQV